MWRWKEMAWDRSGWQKLRMMIILFCACHPNQASLHKEINIELAVHFENSLQMNVHRWIIDMRISHLYCSSGQTFWNVHRTFWVKRYFFLYSTKYFILFRNSFHSDLEKCMKVSLPSYIYELSKQIEGHIF